MKDIVWFKGRRPGFPHDTNAGRGRIGMGEGFHLSKDPILFETVKDATTPAPCDPETRISPER